MRSKDRVVGGLLLGVSLLVMISAWRLPETAAAEVMGPKAYPLALALILAGFSLALLRSRDGGKGAKLDRAMLLRGFLPIVASLAAYVVLLPRLGFVLTTTALLLICFRLKDERNWRLNLSVAAGSTLVIYLLFAQLLNVPLKLLPSLF